MLQEQLDFDGFVDSFQIRARAKEVLLAVLAPAGPFCQLNDAVVIQGILEEAEE